MQIQHDITIIGCGWLGLPLAKYWTNSGLIVAGTTTHTERLELLTHAGIAAYLVQLDSAASADLENVLRSNTVVIAVPPRSKQQLPQVYFDEMQKLAKALANSPVSQIILLSSTSVYPGSNSVCTENSATDSQNTMALAENVFPKAKTAIIRFGGLIGPNRHPGRFFSGKRSIRNGQAPVNLIHQHDCIAIIDFIRQKKLTGIFNGVAPSHPQKQVFYTEAIARLGGSLPASFVDELLAWKQIEPEKLHKRGFRFRHPDLLEALNKDIW